MDSVTDSFAVEAIAKIRAAGCDLFAYSCDAGLGIPTFIAVIVDREKETGLFKGYGCHLSPEIALNRSICEAAQARCLIMAGARDDVLWTHHRAVLARRARKDWHADSSSFPIDVRRDDLQDRSTGSAREDIETAVNILASQS